MPGDGIRAALRDAATVAGVNSVVRQDDTGGGVDVDLAFPAGELERHLPDGCSVGLVEFGFGDARAGEGLRDDGGGPDGVDRARSEASVELGIDLEVERGSRG